MRKKSLLAGHLNIEKHSSVPGTNDRKRKKRSFILQKCKKTFFQSENVVKYSFTAAADHKK